MLNEVSYGLVFPVRLEEGSIPKSSLVQAIESNLRIMLNWPTDTRNFNLPFGINLEQYLQEPNDPISQVSIRKAIHNTVTRFEPRVIIQSIDFDNYQDTIKILLRVKIKNTQDVLTIAI